MTAGSRALASSTLGTVRTGFHKVKQARERTLCSHVQPGLLRFDVPLQTLTLQLSLVQFIQVQLR